MAAYGVRNRSMFKIDDLNEMMMKIVYRRHNAYVLQVSSVPLDIFDHVALEASLYLFVSRGITF